MSEKHLLSDALEDVSREARAAVTSSVYSALFNAANDLAGNTQAGDLDWFAGLLWHAFHRESSWGHWRQVTGTERAYWVRMAEVSLTCLPELMGRIAHRCEVQAEAVRSLMAAEQAALRRRWREVE